VDKGFQTTGSFFLSSSTDPMNTPFVCREATGAGIAGQQPPLFYLWVFQSSRRFFFPFAPLSEHSVLSFLPGDDDDPYLEMGFVGSFPGGTRDHV
jgi:hypothetical protein